MKRVRPNSNEVFVPTTRSIDLNVTNVEIYLLAAMVLLSTSTMTQLSHVDDQGRVRMVDTANKEITARRASASARVLMNSETVAALREHRTPKGDPLEAARLAGIMAAKKTSDLIPLCHPLPLTHIDVQATVEDDGVSLEAEVSTNAQTGVEMEALTAVSVAALTIYDMCKALEKGMMITEIRLDSKTGGKSGEYKRT
jgi:cyclic pyranopterin monophosphate synthase